MSDRMIKEFLRDILEASHRIYAYTDSLEYEEFLEDLKTQDAVVRNMEIIGEATEKLPDNFRQEYDLIPWRSLAGMRDKLIHDYFGVNFDIVWEVLKHDLPGLEERITEIIEILDEKEAIKGHLEKNDEAS